MAALTLLVLLSLCLTEPILGIVQTDDAHMSVAPGGVHSTCGAPVGEDIGVNCTFLMEQASQFSTISALILYKADGQGVYREIASISSSARNSTNIKDSLCASHTGQLLASGQSFISYKWPVPSREAVGDYKCEAYGLDDTQHPLFSTANATITAASFDAMFLQKLADIGTRLEAEQDLIKDVKARLDQSQTVSFVDSAEYNGHTYLLSHPSLRDTAVSESACHVHGGYLVEINNAAEFTFVKNLLSRNNVNKYVSTGVSDAGHEGTWSFLHGNTSPYLNWHQGQPDRSGDQNCVVIDGSRMRDTNCRRDNIGYFLCEIP